MYWSWKRGGLALGIVFFITVFFRSPIGVSTQFVVFDGILASAVDSELITENDANKSGYGSSNPYLDKSGGKIAGLIASPLQYSPLFVLSMLLGGFLGRLRSTGNPEARTSMPQCHLRRFGDTPWKRYLFSFIGGVVVLFGARLAGGCTSGHMMSGMMQTAVSGYLFAFAAFLVAIPTALLIYRK